MRERRGSESQLNIAASRLRRGTTGWEEASLFWASADRNGHSAALWTNPDTGRLHHYRLNLAWLKTPTPAPV